MFLRHLIFMTVCLLLIAPGAWAEGRLRLATTTSTENSGLLMYLLPPFEKASNSKVDIVAVGTGKALKLGEYGDVDVVLVHARSKENKFIAEGFGVDRRDVMYNDFVLLGPPEDLASIKEVKDVVAALSKIAVTNNTFISRSDDSGTHTREKQLWEQAGIKPSGDWYLETGRGMGEVIIMADQQQGYTITDRGTYIAYKNKISLEIMIEGESRLFNPYGVMMVNPEKHPHINTELTKEFLNYLTSSQAKELITSYRKNGEQLFYVTE